MVQDQLLQLLIIQNLRIIIQILLQLITIEQKLDEQLKHRKTGVLAMETMIIEQIILLVSMMQ